MSRRPGCAGDALRGSIPVAVAAPVTSVEVVIIGFCADRAQHGRRPQERLGPPTMVLWSRTDPPGLPPTYPSSSSPMAGPSWDFSGSLARHQVHTSSSGSSSCSSRLSHHNSSSGSSSRGSNSSITGSTAVTVRWL